MASAGQPVLPLFRFWDLLYNGAADGVELVWLLGFGVAAAGVAGFPRWFPALSALAALLHVPLVFGVLLGLDNTAHTLLYLPSILWWPAVLLGLARHARIPHAAPAPAARLVPMPAGKP
jgi:hypothetical protein